MSQGHPFNLNRIPELRNPSLIVGWNQDAGRLGSKVIDFLNRKLGCQEFGEIEPPDFFHLGGVSVESDVIQFPESKFYWSREKDVVIFQSDGPSREHYRFLSSLLDVAQHYCKVRELYAVGGVVSMITHTAPRRISAVVNRPQLKSMLAPQGIDTSRDYRTPVGGRPTLNSFLLWLAGGRNLPGVNLWGEVSFYLTATEDLRICKQMLVTLDRRLDLGMDLSEVDMGIRMQTEKLEELRAQDPDVDKYLEVLGRGIMLNEEESEKLIRTVTEHLETKS